MDLNIIIENILYKRFYISELPSKAEWELQIYMKQYLNNTRKEMMELEKNYLLSQTHNTVQYLDVVSGSTKQFPVKSGQSYQSIKQMQNIVHQNQ